MSCLFNSLSHFFPQNSFTIRQNICDYLQQGGTIIDGLDTNLILSFERPNYISHMRNTATWGGAIEIQAACKIWNTNIVVHNIRDRNAPKIYFYPFDNPNCNKSINITWSGGHYEPLRH
tara:strand:- start:50 stop:406 length:357 start_codon:yes stop_codon:yes gene_type:complete